jgi:hypothetical protein
MTVVIRRLCFTSARSTGICGSTPQVTLSIRRLTKAPRFSFHYQAEYDGSFGDPAEVFVLVSGREPLSKMVGDDLRLGNACSEGHGLENSVIDTAGAALPRLDPGHHVTVVVDQLAGQTLALDDPGLHPWKAMTVDGGVDLFDPTGIIFLKGLTDNSDIEFQLLDRRGKHALTYSAADLRTQGGGGHEAGAESATSQPNQPAEVADNRLVIYHAAQGETHVDAYAKTEFPSCGEPKCLVYAYDGQAYVVPETKHIGGLQLWPEDFWFAHASDWPWAPGQTFGHGPMLAANSDQAGSGAAAPDDLGTYWLEHNPSAGVVAIDHFFERAGDPNPPGLSGVRRHPPGSPGCAPEQRGHGRGHPGALSRRPRRRSGRRVCGSRPRRPDGHPGRHRPGRDLTLAAGGS